MSPTPGPWNLIYYKGEFHVNAEIVSETGRPRSTVMAFILSAHRMPAYEDIHLMVAAPELLEACKLAERQLDCCASELGDTQAAEDAAQIAMECRTAIAKAESVSEQEVK